MCADLLVSTAGVGKSLEEGSAEGSAEGSGVVSGAALGEGEGLGDDDGFGESLDAGLGGERDE